MKASKKYLTMEIEFQDYGDLKYALNKAWESIKTGKEWNRFQVGSSMIQYQFQRYIDESNVEDQMNYREEIIDGKLCIVIPSKMNRK